MDFRVEHDYQDIGHKVTLLNARQVLDAEEKKIFLPLRMLPIHSGGRNDAEKLKYANFALQSEKDTTRRYRLCERGYLWVKR